MVHMHSTYQLAVKSGQQPVSQPAKQQQQQQHNDLHPA